MNAKNKSTKKLNQNEKKNKKKETFGTLISNDYNHKFTKSPTVKKNKNLNNKISANKKHFVKTKKNCEKAYKQRETPKSKIKPIKNEMCKNENILLKSYHPIEGKGHNIYSSMFSEGQGMQSQINSMVFPQRPASNTSMTANSEYNINHTIETSQNSLRQAIMSVLKNKNSKNNMDTVISMQEGGTPLDTRFTKSLQIQSPGSKFSNRESKPAVKSPAKRLFLKYKTTLHGHSNTVNCLAFDTKYYSHLFSGSKDYSVKIWH